MMTADPPYKRRISSGYVPRPSPVTATACAVLSIACGGAAGPGSGQGATTRTEVEEELPSPQESVLETRADTPGPPPGQIPFGGGGVATLVAALDRAPSGVASDGDRLFVALPRWGGGDITVVELVDGEPSPYPPGVSQVPSEGVEALHSVNGLHLDREGRLWILDNARIDLGPGVQGAPKVVIWDTRDELEVARFHFPGDVAPSATSFLNDIAVSPEGDFAYVSETGIGGSPAIVVWNVTSGESWRALDGSDVVRAVPDRTMTIEGEPVQVSRDGQLVPWRVGINPIALDPTGELLYFGPMTGERLFAVPTALLREPGVDRSTLEAAVRDAGPKPICDGMAVRGDGTVYFTGVESHAILALDAGTAIREIASSPWFSFPVAIEPLDDGRLWFTTSQLHRGPMFHGGSDLRVPPFGVWSLVDPVATQE